MASNGAEITSVVYAGMGTRDGTVLGRQLFPAYESERAWQERVESEGLTTVECDVMVTNGNPIPDGTGQGLLSSASWNLLTAADSDDEESIVMPIPQVDIKQLATRYEELARQAEAWLGRGGMTIVLYESAGEHFKRLAERSFA